MDSDVTSRLLLDISPNMSCCPEEDSIYLYHRQVQQEHMIQPGVYIYLFDNYYDGHEMLLLVHSDRSYTSYSTHWSSQKYSVINGEDVSEFHQRVLDSHSKDVDDNAFDRYCDLIGVGGIEST